MFSSENSRFSLLVVHFLRMDDSFEIIRINSEIHYTLLAITSVPTFTN